MKEAQQEKIDITEEAESFAKELWQYVKKKDISLAVVMFSMVIVAGTIFGYLKSKGLEGSEHVGRLIEECFDSYALYSETAFLRNKEKQGGYLQ